MGGQRIVRAPTRSQELTVAATIAAIVAVKVGVAARFGTPALAAFVAAAGVAAVVVYIAAANQLIRDASRRTG